MFKKLYPDMPLIPKHHFMIHYGGMVAIFGPLVKLWCMTSKSEYRPFKCQAYVVCNFRNISKTLVYKNQIQTMYNYVLYKAHFGIFGTQWALSWKAAYKNKDFWILITIHVAHTVHVLGQTYKTGSVVLLILTQEVSVCLVKSFDFDHDNH